jgi:hypothetical protein
MIFEVADYAGVSVALSEETWQTKAGNGLPGSHPEIRSYLLDIQAAIESPDFVFESTRDSRSYAFYQLDCGRGDFIGKHLVVIVKYVIEDTELRGYVSTVYLTRRVYTKGRLLWKKTENRAS